MSKWRDITRMATYAVARERVEEHIPGIRLVRLYIDKDDRDDRRYKCVVRNSHLNVPSMPLPPGKIEHEVVCELEHDPYTAGQVGSALAVHVREYIDKVKKAPRVEVKGTFLGDWTAAIQAQRSEFKSSAQVRSGVRLRNWLELVVQCAERIDDHIELPVPQRGEAMVTVLRAALNDDSVVDRVNVERTDSNYIRFDFFPALPRQARRQVFTWAVTLRHDIGDPIVVAVPLKDDTWAVSNGDDWSVVTGEADATRAVNLAFLAHEEKPF